MKRTNSKKGLAALMAAVMGVSMFAVAGAGIVNAKGDKGSDEKKPKKSVQFTMDDFTDGGKSRKPENAFIIKRQGVIRKLNDTLLRDINNRIAAAENLPNSSREIVASLNAVKESFYDTAKAELEKLSYNPSLFAKVGMMIGFKTINQEEEQELKAMEAIYEDYNDKAQKRLKEIDCYMMGTRYTEVDRMIDTEINRKNALKQYFNNNDTVIERGELNSIEALLNRSKVMAQSASCSESTLAAIKNNISKEISQRLSKLEGIKDGNYYLPVKEHLDALKARVTSIKTNNHGLVEEKNDILLELDRLKQLLEAHKYSVTNVNTVSDLAKECESRIVNLEKNVNSGFFGFIFG